MEINTTLLIALLATTPALIVLQSFWIAFSLNKIYKRIDRVDERMDNLQTEMRTGLDKLQTNLHNHEIHCAERQADVNMRLDRLERNEATAG